MFTLGDVADILDSALETGISIVDALGKLSEAAEAGKLDRKQIFDELNLVDTTVLQTECDYVDVSGDHLGHNLDQHVLASSVVRFDESQRDFCNNNYVKYAQGCTLPADRICTLGCNNDLKIVSECTLNSSGNENLDTILEKRASCPPRLGSEVLEGLCSPLEQIEYPVYKQSSCNVPLNFNQTTSLQSSIEDVALPVLTKQNLGQLVTANSVPLLRDVALQDVQKHGLPIIEALGDLAKVAEDFLIECRDSCYLDGSSSDFEVANENESSLCGAENSEDCHKRDVLESMINARVTEILHSFQNLDNTMNKLSCQGVPIAVPSTTEVSSAPAPAALTDSNVVVLRRSSKKGSRPKTFVMYDSSLDFSKSSCNVSSSELQSITSNQPFQVQISSSEHPLHFPKDAISTFSKDLIGSSKDSSLSINHSNFESTEKNSDGFLSSSSLVDPGDGRLDIRKNVVVRRNTYVIQKDSTVSNHSAMQPMTTMEHGFVMPRSMPVTTVCSVGFEKSELKINQTEEVKNCQSTIVSSDHLILNYGISLADALADVRTCVAVEKTYPEFYQASQFGVKPLHASSQPIYVQSGRPWTYLVNPIVSSYVNPNEQHGYHVSEDSNLISSISFVCPTSSLSDASHSSSKTMQSNLELNSAFSVSHMLQDGGDSVCSKYPVVQEMLPELPKVDPNKTKTRSRPLTYQLSMSRRKPTVDDDLDDSGNLSDSDTPGALLSSSRLSSGSLGFESHADYYSSPFKLNRRKRLGRSTRLANLYVSPPTVVALGQLYKVMSTSLSKLSQLHNGDKNSDSSSCCRDLSTIENSVESVSDSSENSQVNIDCVSLSTVENFESRQNLCVSSMKNVSAHAIDIAATALAKDIDTVVDVNQQPPNTHVIAAPDPGSTFNLFGGSYWNSALPYHIAESVKQNMPNVNSNQGHKISMQVEHYEISKTSDAGLENVENIIKSLEAQWHNKLKEKPSTQVLQGSHQDMDLNVDTTEFADSPVIIDNKNLAAEKLVLERSGTYVLDNSDSVCNSCNHGGRVPNCKHPSSFQAVSEDGFVGSVALASKALQQVTYSGGSHQRSKQKQGRSCSSSPSRQTQNGIASARGRSPMNSSASTARPSSLTVTRARSLSPRKVSVSTSRDRQSSLSRSQLKTGAWKAGDKRGTYILQQSPSEKEASVSSPITKTSSNLCTGSSLIVNSKQMVVCSSSSLAKSGYSDSRKYGLLASTIKNKDSQRVDVAHQKAPVHPPLGRKTNSSLSPSTICQASSRFGCVEPVGIPAVNDVPRLSRRSKTLSSFDGNKFTGQRNVSSVHSTKQPHSYECASESTSHAGPRNPTSDTASRSVSKCASSQLSPEHSSAPASIQGCVKSPDKQSLIYESKKVFLRKSSPSVIPVDGQRKRVSAKPSKKENGELLCTRLATLRMQLEEKRREFEEEKKRKQQTWNEERAKAMQEAFLAVVGGIGDLTNMPVRPEANSGSWEPQNHRGEKSSREVAEASKKPSSESPRVHISPTSEGGRSQSKTCESPRESLTKSLPSNEACVDGSWFIDINGSHASASPSDNGNVVCDGVRNSQPPSAEVGNLMPSKRSSHITRPCQDSAVLLPSDLCSEHSVSTTSRSQSPLRESTTLLVGSAVPEYEPRSGPILGPSLCDDGKTVDPAKQETLGSTQDENIGPHGYARIGKRDDDGFNAPAPVNKVEPSLRVFASESLQRPAPEPNPNASTSKWSAKSPLGNPQIAWEASRSDANDKVLVEEVVFASDNALSFPIGNGELGEDLSQLNEKVPAGASLHGKIALGSLEANPVQLVSSKSNASWQGNASLSERVFEVVDSSLPATTPISSSSTTNSSKRISVDSEVRRKLAGSVQAWADEKVRRSESDIFPDQVAAESNLQVSEAAVQPWATPEVATVLPGRYRDVEFASTLGSSTSSPEQEQSRAVQVTPAKPTSWAFTFGDDEALPDTPGLTPEQIKKREKFVRNRQKKLEEEKMKKEAELEEKKRLQELAALEELTKKEHELMAATERLQSAAYTKRLNDLVYQVPVKQGAAPLEQRASSRDLLSRQTSSGSSTPSESNDVQPSNFSEYNGPTVYQKPSGKSNRKIIQNAIMHCCLSGEVNKDTKVKCLEAVASSEASHFLVLFREGLKFRSVYEYVPEKETVTKIFGIGPKIITGKMISKYYKYNSGGKEFDELLTKHLSIQVDGLAIKKELWDKKPAGFVKTESKLQKKPSASQGRVGR